MNKPKLAAVLELNRQELEYLLRCIAAESKLYVSTGSRDFYAEDLHDKVKAKLGNSLASFE